MKPNPLRREIYRRLLEAPARSLTLSDLRGWLGAYSRHQLRHQLDWMRRNLDVQLADGVYTLTPGGIAVALATGASA